jgi:hypothetical protein
VRYPADVLAMIDVDLGCDMTDHPSIVTFAFIQTYSHVFGDGELGAAAVLGDPLRHHIAQSCEYVYLHDTFELFEASQIIRPVTLKYNPSQTSERDAVRDGCSTVRTSRVPGYGVHVRPHFFVVAQ